MTLLNKQLNKSQQVLNNLNNPALFKTASFINNQWVNATTAEIIEVVNPFNQEVIGTIPVLSQQQVTQAVEHSQTAQLAWSEQTASHRADILHTWADLIDNNQEDLAKILTIEQGKPLKEARGEIAYANSFIRWFAEEGKRIYGDMIPSKHTDLRYVILKQPVGVCAAITPWNFPAAMITRKVAPALASGCTMIVKPAEETPFSALALAELAKQAGVPAGVLQIVTGQPEVVGAVLTKDSRVRKLSFTGSTQVGRLLAEQSASSVKKLSLELGGNAPFIVFDDADIDKAVDGLIASKYRNAGQTCICANRIYLHRSISEKFIQLFSKKVQELTVGNGLDENTDIGVLINQQAMDKAQSLLQDATDKGATIIIGDDIGGEIGGEINTTSPLLMQPTVISNVTPDMDIAKAEIFAPIAPIFVFDTEEEVIIQANDTEYGLAAYFYTKDVARSWLVSESLEYGMVAQNTGMFSNEVTPFGGIKQSGYGREGSKFGIDEYVVTKYWCQDIS